MANLVIIDYGSGNLRSVAKACERALNDHNIKGQVIVSNDPNALKNASHILLPGVGAFGDSMQGLGAIDGMMEALKEQVFENKKWFLGICVGMQLLFNKGFEHGEYEGLGWISGEVRPFIPTDTSLKVPHMGWNQLTVKKSSLLEGIENGDHAYFVHSYRAVNVAPQHILATTSYGEEVISVVGKDNIFGTQFHPEKSQTCGLTLLANFMRF